MVSKKLIEERVKELVAAVLAGEEEEGTAGPSVVPRSPDRGAHPTARSPNPHASIPTPRPPRLPTAARPRPLDPLRYAEALRKQCSIPSLALHRTSFPSWPKILPSS
jgi:hypothetical protein